jgi:hypothetical protein
MRAIVMHGARDVRIETVPDEKSIEQTDAVLRVTRACITLGSNEPYCFVGRDLTREVGGHGCLWN